MFVEKRTCRDLLPERVDAHVTCCVIFLLHSDTASLNSLGYCRIEGRMKDLIIRGGENIYPAEIEQFLFTHPKVQEVQVRLGTTAEVRFLVSKQATKYAP